MTIGCLALNWTFMPSLLWPRNYHGRDVERVQDLKTGSTLTASAGIVTDLKGLKPKKTCPDLIQKMFAPASLRKV